MSARGGLSQGAVTAAGYAITGGMSVRGQSTRSARRRALLPTCGAPTKPTNCITVSTAGIFCLVMDANGAAASCRRDRHRQPAAVVHHHSTTVPLPGQSTAALPLVVGNTSLNGARRDVQLLTVDMLASIR